MAMNEGRDGPSSRKKASSASQAVFDLAGDIGIPHTLKELNVPENSIPQMAKEAMKVERPIKNNPRPMTAQIAEEIYRGAFQGS